MQRFVVASLIFVCVYIPDLGQKKISAYQTTATAAKFELSSAEFIAATWATNGLAYRLVDDAMFRKQFGSSIPPGFTRRTLSSTMETLAQRIMGKVYSKLAGNMVTLGVDGWTNTRKEKMYNVVAISNGVAYFVDSVEAPSNSSDSIFAVVKAAKDALEAKGLVVVAVVGDNHSGVQSALSRYVNVCDPVIKIVIIGFMKVMLPAYPCAVRRIPFNYCWLMSATPP